MASSIEKYITVVDVAVQYNPVHSSLPWAGIRFFLQFSINDTKTFDAMIEGLEVLSRVVARYSIFETLYLGSTTAAQVQLKDSLVRLYAAVLSYHCKARKYYNRSITKRMVVNTFRPPELAIAYFYCSRALAEPERADPCEIMRSVIKQLSQSQSRILQPTVDSFENRLEAESDGLPPSTLMLSECTNLLLQIVNTTPATIVIDALDECDPTQRHHLLSFFNNIITTSQNVVKIFVTSRDEKISAPI